MSNDQMIIAPRALLEQFLAGGRQCDREQLRALLDADKCTSCDGSGEYIDALGDWRGYCACPAGVALNNKPAAQPQGEPVAWRVTGRGGLTVTPQYPKWAVGERGLTITPLYAEQPAPVVMPERLQEIHSFLDGSGTLDGYSFGSFHPSGRKFWWRKELRTCLDEMKRPVHANPPPGAEPSGTHHDNDGLDEWRKP